MRKVISLIVAIVLAFSSFTGVNAYTSSQVENAMSKYYTKLDSSNLEIESKISRLETVRSKISQIKAEKWSKLNTNDKKTLLFIDSSLKRKANYYREELESQDSFDLDDLFNDDPIETCWASTWVGCLPDPEIGWIKLSVSDSDEINKDHMVSTKDTDINIYRWEKRPVAEIDVTAFNEDVRIKKLTVKFNKNVSSFTVNWKLPNISLYRWEYMNSSNLLHWAKSIKRSGNKLTFTLADSVLLRENWKYKLYVEASNSDLEVYGIKLVDLNIVEAKSVDSWEDAEVEVSDLRNNERFRFFDLINKTPSWIGDVIWSVHLKAVNNSINNYGQSWNINISDWETKKIWLVELDVRWEDITAWKLVVEFNKNVSSFSKTGAFPIDLYMFEPFTLEWETVRREVKWDIRGTKVIYDLDDVKLYDALVYRIRIEAKYNWKDASWIRIKNVSFDDVEGVDSWEEAHIYTDFNNGQKFRYFNFRGEEESYVKLGYVKIYPADSAANNTSGNWDIEVVWDVYSIVWMIDFQPYVEDVKIERVSVNFNTYISKFAKYDKPRITIYEIKSNGWRVPIIRALKWESRWSRMSYKIGDIIFDKDKEYWFSVDVKYWGVNVEWVRLSHVELGNVKWEESWEVLDWFSTVRGSDFRYFNIKEKNELVKPGYLNVSVSNSAVNNFWSTWSIEIIWDTWKKVALVNLLPYYEDMSVWQVKVTYNKLIRDFVRNEIPFVSIYEAEPNGWFKYVTKHNMWKIWKDSITYDFNHANLKKWVKYYFAIEATYDWIEEPEVRVEMVNFSNVKGHNSKKDLTVRSSISNGSNFRYFDLNSGEKEKVAYVRVTPSNSDINNWSWSINISWNQGEKVAKVDIDVENEPVKVWQITVVFNKRLEEFQEVFLPSVDIYKWEWMSWSNYISAQRKVRANANVLIFEYDDLVLEKGADYKLYVWAHFNQLEASWIKVESISLHDIDWLDTWKEVTNSSQYIDRTWNTFRYFNLRK